MLKFSVITPCHNAELYMAATMSSVLQQTALASGRVALEYIIVDGASTDRTVAIAEAFGHPSVRIFSQPDQGMYDALAFGLSRATGDIHSYLNASDYYFPWAFDALADLFEQERPLWVTGRNCAFNDRRHAVGGGLPFKYRKRMFRSGLYGRVLPFLQQDATFWRRELTERLDMSRLASFRLAGDYYLWSEFSDSAELLIADALLSGWMVHSGQLSQQLGDYMEEVGRFTRRPTPLDYVVAAVDKLLWYSPTRLKKALNRRLRTYDHATGRWG